MTPAWLKHTDPRKRPAELGAVTVDRERDVPVMAWTPIGTQRCGLREAWAVLYPDPHMLSVFTDGRGEPLMLRYAAIDHRDRFPDADVTLRALVRIYDRIAHSFSAELRGWFAEPKIFADVRGLPRIGFVPPVTPRPLEERDLVGVVARTLSSQRSLRAFVAAAERCRTFDELRDLLGPPALTPQPEPGWEHIEAGLGWLALDHATRAFVAFDRACRYDTPRMRELLAVRREALRRGAVRERSRPPADPATRQFVAKFDTKPFEWGDLPRRKRLAPRPTLSLDEVQPQACACEARRDFKAALALYESVTEPSTALDLAKARCRLALGDTGHAIEHAERVLADDPSCTEARTIAVRAWHAKHEPGRALAACEGLAGADMLRAKCLLALGRWDDASAALDAAYRESPTTEVVVLRDLVTRMRRRLAEHVGSGDPIAITRDDLAVLDLDNAEELRKLVALAQHGSDLRIKLVR